MLIVDVTVVAIALPDMGADLGLGRETLSWVVSGYTVGASADGFTRGFTSGAVAAAAAALMALVLTPGHGDMNRAVPPQRARGVRTVLGRKVTR
jgi:hypothetical protein